MAKREKSLPAPSALERLIQRKKAKGEKLPATKIKTPKPGGIFYYDEAGFFKTFEQFDFPKPTFEEPKEPPKKAVWGRRSGGYGWNFEVLQELVNEMSEPEKPKEPPKEEVDEWLDNYLEKNK